MSAGERISNDEDFETVRYRKKSKKKPPRKADHKHERADCVLFENFGNFKSMMIGSYCPICGKVMDWGAPLGGKWRKDFSDTPRFIAPDWTDEARREFDPETRTLPYFELTTSMQKYVDIENKE